jgi:hypothetical protein
MIFNLHTFTIVHVIISLIGIGSGFVVLIGLLTSRLLAGWTVLFLVSTVATSVTGFLFPFHGFTPGIALGIISIIVLAIAILARYVGRLVGFRRQTYVITSMVALYLNFFVLIAQSFQKIPALKAVAPTQSEPPFALTQLVVLALFVVLTIVAAFKFRGPQVQMT